MTIWKFPLQVTDRQKVRLPLYAKELCVEMQNGVPCIWAMVNPARELTPRHYRIYGTGHTIPDSDALHYIGTVQQFGGGLVWHVFLELKEPAEQEAP